MKCVGTTKSALTTGPCTPTAAATVAKGSILPASRAGFAIASNSVAIPADRDLYFRDVVAALAGRGWDSLRIVIAIAGRVWIPECYAGHLQEWGIKPVIAAQAWVPLRSIDEAAPDDVAASDLRAVQRAIASGRWRENSQAKQWAGHAVAAAMELDVETHKAKIVALLKTWIGNGALVVVEGEDDRREKRKFVEVGTPADN